MCDRLGVAVSSWSEYKLQYMELLEVLKTNKEFADNLVVDSLYNRARGYEYEEVTKERQLAKDEYGEPIHDENGKPVYELVVTKVVTKTLAPDTTAQIFWLKNRQPEKWRDKQEIDMNAKVETIEIALPEELQ
jgi:transcription elongation factor GreA-like protein